jgi:L-2-hydroxyglutarate oxidase LhgO
MEEVNIVIVGAGVVGLAVARYVSKKNKNVLLLERHESFGQETSSRNSEVIHASIYYPKAFLKGKLCLKGNEMLYDICKKSNIPHSNTGKLIVAVKEDEEVILPELLELAKNNGAKRVRIISKDEIKKLEPNVHAKAAVYCPTSGVVNSHRLMKYFETSSKENGVDFAYGVEVKTIEKHKEGYIINIKDADGRGYKFLTRVFINSAGLESGNIAQRAGIDIDKAGYRINYHKGIYFRVMHGFERFPRMLIYPVPPESGSVGIHTCPDLAGGMRLGPHFFWSNTINYTVDETYIDLFYQTAKQYLPFLKRDDLQPDMAGIMSAIQKPGENMKDFIIKHEVDKGLPGFINLIGIESPGLTSAPAIGEMVMKIVDEVL